MKFIMSMMLKEVVWEEVIIMLPKHINIVLLSATVRFIELNTEHLLIM
jgi:superfamily II RNA helicase